MISKQNTCIELKQINLVGTLFALVQSLYGRGPYSQQKTTWPTGWPSHKPTQRTLYTILVATVRGEHVSTATARQIIRKFTNGSLDIFP